MSAVASEAGINRTTLYRRWPTKARLLSDVLEQRLTSYASLRETAQPRVDLLAAARLMRDNITLPESRALMAALSDGADDRLAAATQQSARATRQIFTALVDKVAESEGIEALDSEIVGQLIFSGVALWELLHRDVPTDQDLSRLIDSALPAPRTPSDRAS